MSTALVGAEASSACGGAAGGSALFATGSLTAVSTRGSVALRLASLLCAALARALAGVLPLAVVGLVATVLVATAKVSAAEVLAAEVLVAEVFVAEVFVAEVLAAAALSPLRSAAVFDAPDRAALALAAVLAAARVLDAAVFALLPRVPVALDRAADLAAVFPVAVVRALLDLDVLDVPAVFVVALPVVALPAVVLPAALALAAFLVRASAEAPAARVLPPAPRRAAATDALRFFAVFLLEGIRGYSFYCPAVETGREAS